MTSSILCVRASGNRDPEKRHKIRRGWQPSLNENGKPAKYHGCFDLAVCINTPTTLPALEQLSLTEPWQQPVLKGLLQQSRDKHERIELSKQITRQLCKHMRQKQNRKLEEIFSEFKDLDRMDTIARDHIKRSILRTSGNEPKTHSFADYLGGIFRSTSTLSEQAVDDLVHYASKGGLTSIPLGSL
mmetsp:Transcript_22488/g.43781  ORF Transcript_22488/g.43781 Transcript_22488/m.43781 type:complete len:186 (-) Transcript_22488:313-870(-)